MLLSKYIYKPTIFLFGSYIGALAFDTTYTIYNNKYNNNGKLITNNNIKYYLLASISLFGFGFCYILT